MTEQVAGTITALVAQKRNQSRVNVFIDGEFAFGLAAIHAARLHKGQHLTAKDIQQLAFQDAVEVAHERALNLLSYRPRSAWEIRSRLEKKGKRDFPPDVLDEVIARLERVGLLDDLEFARYWVGNREQFRPRSKRALRHELRAKGVGDRAIEQALATIDEQAAALRAAQKRASRLADLDQPTFTQRLGDFLARRGFDYEVSREAITRVWEGMSSEPDDDPDAQFGEANSS